MSIPRELTLEKDHNSYCILQYPIKELNSLRKLVFEAENIPISECDMSHLHGKCLDIEVEFEISDNAPFGIRCFLKEERYLEFGYRPAEKMLYVDTRAASDIAFKKEYTMFPCYMSINGNQTKILTKIHTQYYECGITLKVRILLDVSTAEIFIDGGRTACTINIYPQDDADGISLLGNGQIIRFINVYEMNCIW